MRFEDVYWHDGRILSWQINASDDQSKTGGVEFAIAIYEDEQAPDRFRVRLLFEDVESLSLSCNFPDLADHFSAGNIHWAHREGVRTYRFELFGNNAFEVVAGKASIRREK